LSDLSDVRRLWTLTPKLAAAFLQVEREFQSQFPGDRVDLAQAFRTPAMQISAASGGRSPFDGANSFSKHQRFPSPALDLAVFGPDGAYVADGTDPRYTWLGKRFEALGFVWGARFVHPRPDPDHVEEPGSTNPDRPAVESSLACYESILGLAPHLKL
jgi:hypothetical protein